MPGNKGREHARSFLQRTKKLSKVDSPKKRKLIIDTAEDIVLPAVQKEGQARDIVAEAARWAEQPFDENTLREYRANPYHPATKLPDLDEETSIVLASGALRAARELADPKVERNVRQMLRSPEKYHRKFQEKLAELEKDFKSALLLETAQAANEDESFRDELEQTLEDLRNVKGRLREIAISGEGREGSWEIGVIAVCSLAAPWCVAAAVVTVAIVVTVIVVQSK